MTVWPDKLARAIFICEIFFMAKLVELLKTGDVLPDNIDFPQALRVKSGKYPHMVVEDQTAGVVQALEQKQRARDQHPIKEVQEGWRANLNHRPR